MRAKPTLTFNGFSMHPLDALKNTAVLFEAGYLLATSNNHEYCEIGDTIVALATDYAFEVKTQFFIQDKILLLKNSLNTWLTLAPNVKPAV